MSGLTDGAAMTLFTCGAHRAIVALPHFFGIGENRRQIGLHGQRHALTQVAFGFIERQQIDRDAALRIHVQIQHLALIDFDPVAVKQQAIQAELQHVMQFGARRADRFDRL